MRVLSKASSREEKPGFTSADRNNQEHTNSKRSSAVPSAIVQMDDERLVSKLFKGLIMVPIHVPCVAQQNTDITLVSTLTHVSGPRERGFWTVCVVSDIPAHP